MVVNIFSKEVVEVVRTPIRRNPRTGKFEPRRTDNFAIKDQYVNGVLASSTVCHPEERDGQVFLGNTPIPLNDHTRILDGWQGNTLSTGTLALDTNGQPVNGGVPVFISRQEFEENQKLIKKLPH